ncbi:MAG: LPS export ABC transporter ATP-binding protein [Candidatus Aminicenantes bacterium]|nr:LPS export ABC transporter ATP-binding protein [Candidatus Aminicenantes bacterium]
MNLLQTVGLRKKFGHRLVVDDLSLEVRSGERVGLLGPNGAGKTTAFYMIIGLLEPDKGKILLNGQDLTEEPVFQRARKGLGFLSQGSSVFRGLTVEENLLLVWQNLGNKPSAQDPAEKIKNVLKDFGLLPQARLKASHLSGGERRKLEIARAMIREPRFLLLDEPFSELDPKSVADLQEIIIKLKEKEVGILLTDHRIREAVTILDRIYIINKGKIVAEGKPEEVLEKQEVREIYLGQEFRL